MQVVKSKIAAALFLFSLLSATEGRAEDVTMFARAGENKETNVRLIAGFETDEEIAGWVTENGATIKISADTAFEGKYSAEITFPAGSPRVVLAAGARLPADISRSTFFLFNIYNPDPVGRRVRMSLMDENGAEFAETFEIDSMGFLTAALRIRDLAAQIDPGRIKQFSLARDGDGEAFAFNLDNVFLFNRPEDQGVEGKITRIKRGDYEILSIDDGTPSPAATPEDLERGFLAFKRNYLRCVYPNTVPKPEEILQPGNKLSVRTSPGEYEPVAVGIYPLEDGKEFSLYVTDLTGPESKKISTGNVNVQLVNYAFFPVGPRPLNQCMALPKDLHVKRSIRLKKNETRQYWLTVHVPEDASPGVYTGEVVLRGGKKYSIPLEVEVLPIVLESPPGVDFVMLFEKAFREIGWLSNSGSTEKIPDDTVVLSRGRIIYRDLKAHGMTCASPYCHDVYREKANGDPYLPVAETALEEAKRAGLMGPAICVYTKMFKTEKLNRSTGTYAEYNPEVQPKQAKKIAEYLTRKAKENGWPQPVICAIDEPAEPARNQIAVELNRAIKEVPGAMTHLACTQYSLKNPFPWIDIVNFNTFLYDPAEIEKVKKAGKKIWIYDNASVIRVNAARSRFVYGLFGWRAGLDGVTSWTYPLDVYSSWRVDVFGKQRPNWDPETGYPVTCREWEAIREGIDDRRYIYTLEKLIEKARHQQKVEAAAGGQNLIDELWSRLNPDLKQYNFSDLITEELLYNNFFKPEELEQYRQRIIDEILKLQQALASPEVI